MYHPTTRLLTVLEMLQARPQTSAAQLASRLEVDPRTVRRYLTMLQDMGIPVEGTRGRYGGYRLRPGFKLPPLIFNDEEALAVTLGLMAARQLGLTTAAPAIEGALAKVQRVLPTAVSSKVKMVGETIAFTQPPRQTHPVEGPILLTLSAAVQEQRRVRLRYRGREGAQSERDVDPYGLAFHFGRWYLVGFDFHRGEVRVFRADRVLDLAPRDETFERPTGFDTAEYVTQTLASIPWGFEVKVLLDASLTEARSSVPAWSGNLTEAPDGVELYTQAEDLGMAARYLVGIGCDFTVLHPPELRKEVRRLGKDLVELSLKER